MIADTEGTCRRVGHYLALEAKEDYIDLLLLGPVFDHHRDQPADRGAATSVFTASG